MCVGGGAVYGIQVVLVDCLHDLSGQLASVVRHGM